MRFIRNIIIAFFAKQGFTVIKTSMLSAERAELRNTIALAADQKAAITQLSVGIEAVSPASPPRTDNWYVAHSVDDLLNTLWSERSASASRLESLRRQYDDDISRLNQTTSQLSADLSVHKTHLRDANAALEKEKLARFELEADRHVWSDETESIRRGLQQEIDKERTNHAGTARSLNDVQASLASIQTALAAERAARAIEEEAAKYLHDAIAALRDDLERERQNHAITSQSLNQALSTLEAKHASAEAAVPVKQILHLMEAVWARGAAEKKYFNLISCGRTATHWIAKSLSLHPDVMCAHGPELSPYREDEDEMERTARHHREAEQMASLNLDEYYDILERREFKAYGVIHGIAGFDAVHRPGFYRRQYYVAGLTRHPVARTQSFASRWLFEYEHLEGERSEMMARAIERLAQARTWGLPLPPTDAIALPDRLFISGAIWMLANEPVKDREIPCFRIEDITSNRDNFAGFFRELTQGGIPLTDDYLDAVMQFPSQDRMNPAAPPDTVYNDWPEWKQRFLTQLLAREGVTKRYEELGYDLSFLRD